jgi:glycosyltransferase involved in cell wall biosynthesis
MNVLAIPTTFGLFKPISGGQNRFSNLLKELKKRRNKIIVLESYSVMDDGDTDIATIYSYNDLKFFNRTLSIFRDLNLNFIKKVLKIIRNERIDLIQISHPSGILVAKIIIKLTRKNIPIIYDAHNVESNFVIETFVNNEKYSKLEKSFIPIYITILEKVICKYFVNHITAVSDEDRTFFINKYKLDMEKVSVIPSGCLILNKPDEKYKKDIKREMGIDPDKIIIFFHGLFSHPPNKEAFDIIINYLAPKFEEINKRVLFIVGGTGFPNFEQPNIKSLGFIEDLYKVISIADISIVPLIRGSGTKLKIFDYLAAGLPIVTTKKGIEGINAKNDEHAIIVDGVNDDFIDAIKYLIENEEERKRIGANARRLAEEKYDWDKIGEKLDKLYGAILESRRHADK